MRNLILPGLLAVTLTTTTMMGCGGDKPAQDPSTATPPAPTTPAPEATPPMADSKPVDATPPADPTPAKPADKPLTDGEIVAVTSTANNGEIEMAELAKKTATNADVKGFAAMMIMQHKDMETKGKAVATKAKITSADSDTSTSLKSDVQSTISSLKTQKGKDFDKAYMDSQVKAHQDVLDMFDKKLLPNAQNGELKSLLTDGRAHVAAHLAKAQEIQGKLSAAPAATPAKPAAPKK